MAAGFAPYLLAEIFALERKGQPLVLEWPNDGELTDEYWSVIEIAPDVFAIGEPRYYQANWSFLIVGQSRALLFDTGPGINNIAAIVATLTDKPVQAMPSHLHFDHTGGLQEFDEILMLDVPSIKRQSKSDRIHPSRYQHLGFVDGQDDQLITVTQWIVSGDTFDLGERELKVLSVPGHTPDSVVVIDETAGLLFTGDFLYAGPLYAMLPGSSRSAYLKSTEMLLDFVPEDVRIYGAHASNADLVPPTLTRASLQRLRDQLLAAESGTLAYEGVLPRQIPIDEDVEFLTGFPWNNK